MLARRRTDGEPWPQLDEAVGIHPIDLLQLQHRIVAPEAATEGEDAVGEGWAYTWDTQQRQRVHGVEVERDVVLILSYVALRPRGRAHIVGARHQALGGVPPLGHRVCP